MLANIQQSNEKNKVNNKRKIPEVWQHHEIEKNGTCLINITDASVEEFYMEKNINIDKEILFSNVRCAKTITIRSYSTWLLFV
jgi:hypothetical protein